MADIMRPFFIGGYLDHIVKKTNHKMVMVMVAFDAGARAEGNKYSPGIAHMLEHMMFKGTKKRSYLDIPKDIADIGGEVNAYTSNEQVVYYIKVPYDNLEAAMEILHDITLHSTFPEEEFLKEREVVLEECLSEKDEIHHDLFIMLYDKFFDNRLRIPVIGTEESIKGFTREELVSFYKEFYKNESGIVTVVGDVNEEDTHRLIQKYFGERTDFHKATFGIDAEQKKAASFEVKKPKLEHTYVYICYPGLKIGEEDKIVLTVMNQIFGSGMDSRLFTQVREKNNLCYSINMSESSYMEKGICAIQSSTRKENLDKMYSIIDEEILKIKSELVLDEELKRAKIKIKSDVYSTYDSAWGISSDLLSRKFFELKDMEDVLKKLDTITKEQVRDIARQIFVEENKMLFVMTEGQE